MHIITMGTGPFRSAPFPDGPDVEILVDERAGAGRLGAAQITIPPGGGMPGHAHGASTTLLVPLTGEGLVVRREDHAEKVTRGSIVLLDRGERVGLENLSSEPVCLLAVFGPADFVRALERWSA